MDPNKGLGARFIHAILHLTVSDILSPTDVPLVVQTFFDQDRAVNHDGHTCNLLSVQVTELFHWGCLQPCVWRWNLVLAFLEDVV